MRFLHVFVNKHDLSSIFGWGGGGGVGDGSDNVGMVLSARDVLGFSLTCTVLNFADLIMATLSFTSPLLLYQSPLPPPPTPPPPLRIWLSLAPTLLRSSLRNRRLGPHKADNRTSPVVAYSRKPFLQEKTKKLI